MFLCVQAIQTQLNPLNESSYQKPIGSDCKTLTVNCVPAHKPYVNVPSRLCMCSKSLALLCYSSPHWLAAAAGSQISPGMAGGRWSVCSGWRAASWAAEVLAAHLLLTVATHHQLVNHAITLTWYHIHGAFRSEIGFFSSSGEASLIIRDCCGR